MSLLIKNVRLNGERTDILTKNGMIEAIGEIPKERKESVDDIIDGTGTFVCPSLLNGHTHAGMTLFRGFGDDMPLQE